MKKTRQKDESFNTNPELGASLSKRQVAEAKAFVRNAFRWIPGCYVTKVRPDPLNKNILICTLTLPTVPPWKEKAISHTTQTRRKQRENGERKKHEHHEKQEKDVHSGR